MRKTVTILVALGLVLASTAFADVLLSETFSYPDGGITTVSGGLWAVHSGTSVDPQIASGEVVTIGSNANDVNRSFTAQTATATTYASYKIKVIGTAASGTVYVAHMKNTSTYFVDQTFIIGTGTSTYSIGISGTSTLNQTWPTPLNCDTWYTIVVSYDASTGYCKLWVDPANESSPSITATNGYTGTLVSAFALRQATPSNTIHFDNLGVGTTWADAYNGGPTPVSSTTWGRLKELYR